jgi:imidazolonepropionase-like amidohydrolase
VKAAVGPALLTRWSLDLLEHRESNAADLARARVPVALCGLGGEAFPAGALRLEASVAVRGGLAPDLALRAITSEPAAALGLGERIGSIAPGRDGDLVILDGDPLSALSRVLRVVVEGRVVFGREREL